jgi:hypothetical protein
VLLAALELLLVADAVGDGGFLVAGLFLHGCSKEADAGPLSGCSWVDVIGLLPS